MPSSSRTTASMKCCHSPLRRARCWESLRPIGREPRGRLLTAKIGGVEFQLHRQRQVCRRGAGRERVVPGGQMPALRLAVEVREQPAVDRDHGGVCLPPPPPQPLPPPAAAAPAPPARRARQNCAVPCL